MTNSGILKVSSMIALAVASIVTSTAAMAGPPAATFGSAAILTNRTCVVSPNGECQLGTRNYLQFAGGAGSSFTLSATNEGNSGAAGSAYSNFNNSIVPTLGVASFSGANTRTGSSALAYQTFAYAGSQAINLALTGTLHYFGSGNLTSTGVQGLEIAGSGFFGANLTILPTSVLKSIGTSGQELIDSLTPLSDCSAGATATAFSSSLGLGAGEHNIPLSLTTACNGGAITIQPGQAFVILSTVQAISNMGGYLDASHTFSAFFDPDKTVFADSGQAVGATYLSASIAALPEPSAWALMILGFGFLGATLRGAPRAAAQIA